MSDAEVSTLVPQSITARVSVGRLTTVARDRDRARGRRRGQVDDAVGDLTDVRQEPRAVPHGDAAAGRRPGDDLGRDPAADPVQVGQPAVALEVQLDDSVDLSTVTVTFTATEEVVLPADDNLGFLPGLQAGWRGLQSATAVALTIIGGLLPFTVLTLLIAVPLWLLLRRRSQPRGASSGG